MNLFKYKLLQTSLLSGAALLSLGAGSALAQDQAPAPATSSVEELVVTGSRIRKNEFTSESPVTVITAEQATLAGLVDTAELLQTTPVASGSFQVNGLMQNFVNDGGPGAQTISIRGLGPNRTLVLLDGRRVGPAGVRGNVGPVDLNVLPNAIIERTEILKDGASSIYGSDAVAGVVNFITKKRYDGGEITAFADVPFRGEGEEFQINGSWGKTFEKGHIMLAVDAYWQKELAYGDRKYTRCAEDRVYDPDTMERLDYTDALTGKTKCYNVLTNVAQVPSAFGGVFQYRVPGVTYPTAAQGNNIDAPTLFPQLAATWTRAGRGGLAATQPYMNYDTPLYATQSAIAPDEHYTVYAAGGYDLAPGVELYADVLYSHRESAQHGFQQLFPDVDATNPTNPFVDGAGRRYVANPDIAFKQGSKQEVDYIRAVGGLRGKVGDVSLIGGWDWDVYGQISHSDAKYGTDFAWLDRIFATTGPGVACDPSVIDPAHPVGCMTIPWFSQRFLAGEFTPQEEAFLFGFAEGETKYTQALVEASITGDLFTTGAGTVNGAFGVHLRHEKINDMPDPIESSGLMYNLSSAQQTKGSDDIQEVFGEINAPLLRDWAPLGSLEVTGSARYTHYKSYGDNVTWKAGFNWTPANWFRVRGTYGTSFRAPALYELFLGNQTAFQAQDNVDPCVQWGESSNTTLRTNCAALGIDPEYGGGGSSATIITGGGVGILKAETSKAKSIGVILTPNFEGFDVSLAVDYFDIRVDDEVRQLGGSNIVSQCLLSATFPTDPLCSLVERDPAAANHPILTINDSYVNVAKQINRGIDLSAHYRQEFSFGTFTFDGDAVWQLEDTTQLLGESEPEDFNGSTFEPDFTAQLRFRFDRGDWTVFWQTDILSKASDTDLFDFNFTDVHPSSRYASAGAGSLRDVYYKQFTEAVAYHNVSVRRKLDTWTLQLGIHNLFDEQPAAISGLGSYTGPARPGYSLVASPTTAFLGRSGWMRITKSF